jgi:hypothetical protein
MDVKLDTYLMLRIGLVLFVLYATLSFIIRRELND